MISSEEKNRIVGEVDRSTTRPLTKRQTNLLYERLNGVTRNQVRKALDGQALRDRFSFEYLLVDLERAARTNKATDSKPFHAPGCQHGCEGEGWVPGPKQHARMMRDGETVRLSRCPGQEMTQAVWDGVKRQHKTWQPAEGARDVPSLLADAKAVHKLPAPSDRVRSQVGLDKPTRTD